MCEYHLVLVGIVSRLGASFVFSNFLPRYPPQKSPFTFILESSLLLSFLFLPKGMHA